MEVRCRALAMRLEAGRHRTWVVEGKSKDAGGADVHRTYYESSGVPDVLVSKEIRVSVP